MFVLDTSVTASWLFPEEVNDYGESVLRLLEWSGALVPSIWPLEVANVLVENERRQRLTVEQSAGLLDYLEGLAITISAGDTLGESRPLLALAREHNLTSYDASYLYLALQSELMLATQDARLRMAAERIGLWLSDPATSLDGTGELEDRDGQ